MLDMTVTDLSPTADTMLRLTGPTFVPSTGRRRSPTARSTSASSPSTSTATSTRASAPSCSPSRRRRAASTRPTGVGRAALAGHVAAVGEVLSCTPSTRTRSSTVLETHLPELAERIDADHHVLDARIAWLAELAHDAAGAAAADQRRLGHLLYLELSAFTSAYLVHQVVEERIVMPALERAIGVEAVVDMHLAIVGSIPPDEMAESLAFMLPAMNLDDRTELLGGMRMTAPPEAFAGVVGSGPLGARPDGLPGARRPDGRRLTQARARMGA